MQVLIQFSPQDALILLGVLPVLVTVLTSLLKTRFAHLPEWAKFGLAALLSVLAGVLTVYARNDTSQPVSIIVFASLILTAASVFYHTWFKGLGLEDWIRAKGAHAQREYGQG